MTWRIALVMAAVVVSVSAWAAEAPPLTVIGAVRTPDGGIVLCRDLGGHTFSLRVGSSFSGWRLMSVSMDHAVFEKASETAVLKLVEAPSANTPSLVAPPHSAAQPRRSIQPPGL